MAVDPRKAEERMRQFERACRESGLRRTHQRMVIFHELSRSDEHPSAEDLCRRVRREVPTISQDTVYRTLWMLEEGGLVGTVGALHDRIRFDPNTDPHHHFICTRCAEVLDFTSAKLDAYEPPEEVRNWGQIDRMQAELRGTCSKCLEELNE